MARPPKKPEDRRTESVRVPLTEAEKEALEAVAADDETKPVTWAREAILKALKRRQERR
ncbi:MAG: hypothetical protein KDA93_01425 [Planctomycetaceae bacterium]|nr:hypothetical protein [Planctomycetaceae bacterium]